jgi:hypothetical protein
VTTSGGCLQVLRNRSVGGAHSGWQIRGRTESHAAFGILCFLGQNHFSRETRSLKTGMVVRSKRPAKRRRVEGAATVPAGDYYARVATQGSTDDLGIGISSGLTGGPSGSIKNFSRTPRLLVDCRVQ